MILAGLLSEMRLTTVTLSMYIITPAHHETIVTIEIQRMLLKSSSASTTLESIVDIVVVVKKYNLQVKIYYSSLR